jgi:hypothetical protein
MSKHEDSVHIDRCHAAEMLQPISQVIHHSPRESVRPEVPCAILF